MVLKLLILLLLTSPVHAILYEWEVREFSGTVEVIIDKRPGHCCPEVDAIPMKGEDLEVYKAVERFVSAGGDTVRDIRTFSHPQVKGFKKFNVSVKGGSCCPYGGWVKGSDKGWEVIYSGPERREDEDYIKLPETHGVDKRWLFFKMGEPYNYDFGDNYQVKELIPESLFADKKYPKNDRFTCNNSPFPDFDFEDCRREMTVLEIADGWLHYKTDMLGIHPGPGLQHGWMKWNPNETGRGGKWKDMLRVGENIWSHDREELEYYEIPRSVRSNAFLTKPEADALMREWAKTADFKNIIVAKTKKEAAERQSEAEYELSERDENKFREYQKGAVGLRVWYEPCVGCDLKSGVMIGYENGDMSIRESDEKGTIMSLKMYKIVRTEWVK